VENKSTGNFSDIRIKREPIFKQDPINLDALDDDGIQPILAATVKYDLTGSDEVPSKRIKIEDHDMMEIHSLEDFEPAAVEEEPTLTEQEREKIAREEEEHRKGV